MTKNFANFPSPHCHQQSLDTGSTIDEFVRREVELGTKHLTVTDHGYLGACRDIYGVAKENGLNPILGIEGYHRDDNCQILAKHGIEKVKEYYKYGHLTIHAKDQEAYETLIRKVSVADLTAETHGSERKPIFNWADLEEIGGKNVTMTSGCLIGVVSRHILAGRPEIAVDYYNKIRSLVKPGNFYVELFCHRCDKNWVSGVFLHLEDGSVRKYYMGKKVRTDTIEEISVADLSKIMAKGKDVGKLRAIKNNRSWDECEPMTIVKCEMVQDFIQNECLPWCPDGDIQLGANKFLLNMAKMYNDPVIISDDAHYAYPEDREIQNAKLGGMGDSFRFYGNYYRFSSNDAFQYFNQYMGMDEHTFETLLNNNLQWASEFKSFKLENKVSLPVSFYPKDTLAHLYELIKKHGRMDWNDQIRVDRLNSEINLLHKNGTIDLLPYFFLGEEATALYEREGLLTGPGRGSAAGLSIAYLLGITHADPIKYGLSQDRFLTLDRIQSGKLPDIDQDLPNRDVLLPWLMERFGDHCVQIGTNQLLRIKNSIRDVARATWNEVPYEIEKLCKSIPQPPQGIEDRDFIFGYESDDGKEVKGLLYEHTGLQEYTKKYPEQWAKVQKLLGIMRSKSKHASAFLIADRPIHEFIPLMTVNEERTTQYDMHACEASGGLKMDYLCLRTLIDLDKAIKLIQKKQGFTSKEDQYLNGKRVPAIRIVPHNGKLYDIYELPEDQNVFRSICEGDTETVFQVNTSSAQKWLKEFNFWKDEDKGTKLIDSIDGVSAFTALDRPGPLDAISEENGKKRNMLQEYAARSRGMKPIDPIEFMVKELPETNGVMVYQEQLQAIYQKLTGCSGIDANKFRDDISKKRMEKVNGRFNFFMENAKLKVGEEAAKKVWDQTVTFGQYGFNKSHSVCYSLIAYACSYLKYYFPLEWWCAVLGSADKNKVVEKFWKHCKHLVSLPDLRYVNKTFEIQDDKIIAPINLLQGIGDKAHDELLTTGPFTDVADLCQKIVDTKRNKSTVNNETGKTRIGVSALNRGNVSKLIISGVMDSLFPSGLDVVSKLEIFEAELARAMGKKKAQKIDEAYRDVNALQIYQHRKAILPVYTENLIPYLHGMGVDGVIKKTIKLNGVPTEVFSYRPEDPKNISYILSSMGSKSMDGALSFVEGPLLKYMNDDAVVDKESPLHAACAAYVLDYRKFSYKDKKTGEAKTAAEILLEVDGEIFKFVKWPSRKHNDIILPDGELKGTIVVAMLSKWSNKYGFGVDCLVKVQDVLKEK